MSVIDPTPVANTFKVQLTIYQTPKGDKLDIATDPPDLYPDSVLAYLERAVDFYKRSLQSFDIIQKSQQLVADQATARAIRPGRA